MATALPQISISSPKGKGDDMLTELSKNTIKWFESVGKKITNSFTSIDKKIDKLDKSVSNEVTKIIKDNNTNKNYISKEVSKVVNESESSIKEDNDKKVKSIANSIISEVKINSEQQKSDSNKIKNATKKVSSSILSSTEKNNKLSDNLMLDLKEMGVNVKNSFFKMNMSISKKLGILKENLMSKLNGLMGMFPSSNMMKDFFEMLLDPKIWSAGIGLLLHSIGLNPAMLKSWITLIKNPKKVFNTIWDGIKGFLKVMFRPVTALLEKIPGVKGLNHKAKVVSRAKSMNKVKKNIDNIKPSKGKGVVGKTVDFIGDIIGGLWNKIKTVTSPITTIFGPFKSMAGVAKQLVLPVLRKLGPVGVIITAIEGVWGGISAVFGPKAEGLDVTEKIGLFFKETAMSIFRGFIETPGAIVDLLGMIFGNDNAVVSTLKTVTNTIEKIGLFMADAVFGTAIDFLSTTVKTAFGGLIDAAKGVGGMIGSIIDGDWDGVGHYLWQTLKGGLSVVYAPLLSSLETILDIPKQDWYIKMVYNIQDFFYKLPENIKKMFEWMSNKFTSMWDSLKTSVSIISKDIYNYLVDSISSLSIQLPTGIDIWKRRISWSEFSLSGKMKKMGYTEGEKNQLKKEEESSRLEELLHQQKMGNLKNERELAELKKLQEKRADEEKQAFGSMDFSKEAHELRGQMIALQEQRKEEGKTKLSINELTNLTNEMNKRKASGTLNNIVTIDDMKIALEKERKIKEENELKEFKERKAKADKEKQVEIDASKKKIESIETNIKDSNSVKVGTVKNASESKVTKSISDPKISNKKLSNKKVVKAEAPLSELDKIDNVLKSGKPLSDKQLEYLHRTKSIIESKSDDEISDKEMDSYYRIDSMINRHKGNKLHLSTYGTFRTSIDVSKTKSIDVSSSNLSPKDAVLTEEKKLEKEEEERIMKEQMAERGRWIRKKQAEERDLVKQLEDGVKLTPEQEKIAKKRIKLDTHFANVRRKRLEKEKQQAGIEDPFMFKRSKTLRSKGSGPSYIEQTLKNLDREEQNKEVISDIVPKPTEIKMPYAKMREGGITTSEEKEIPAILHKNEAVVSDLESPRGDEWVDKICDKLVDKMKYNLEELDSSEGISLVLSLLQNVISGQNNIQGLISSINNKKDDVYNSSKHFHSMSNSIIGL